MSNRGDYQDDIERDDFFRRVIQPGFPNDMTFVLDVPEELRQENRSFSEDGFDKLLENVHSFLLARTLGTWKSENAPPIEMTVRVNLEFKAASKQHLRLGGPWWHLVDEGGNSIDGSHRLKRIKWRGEQ